MNFDAAAIALLLFGSPGVLFLLALSQASRVRVLATREWLLLLAIVVIPAVALHFVVAELLDFLQVEHRWQILPLLFRNTTEATPPATDLKALAVELAMACALGLASGLMVAKLIVWRWIETSILHGPIYKFVSGFRQRLVRVSILSNVQHNGRYVIYDGFVDDIAMTSDGRIAWVSIFLSTRGLLELEVTDPDGQATTRTSSRPTPIFEDPQITLADGTAYVAAETLTIEGEDILNYHLVALEIYGEEPIKAWLFDRWHDGARQRFVTFLIIVAASFLGV